MIVARAWGVSPAVLRDVTLGEWREMVAVLNDEAREARRRVR